MAATAATRRDGQHREHAFFGNELCASAHPSDPAAALLALGATIRQTGESFRSPSCTALPTADDPSTTTLEPGELILELEVPEVESSVYLKAMDRKRWAFALVGVAASRVGGQTRIALSGAAPVPWLLESLDAATPCRAPRTRWKSPARSSIEPSRRSRSLRSSASCGCDGPLLLLVVGLAACGGGDKKSDKASADELDPDTTYSLVLKTTEGSFTIELDQKLAPHTARSLVRLARNGFFDGTKFHRVVPGFVIQGGDPTGTGSGGPGYSTVDVPPSDAAYTEGVVAMAKTQTEAPGTAGSQFFVVTGKDIGLPPEYAIVGRVTDGMATVEAIEALGVGDGPPSKPVVIKNVTVQES